MTDNKTDTLKSVDVVGNRGETLLQRTDDSIAASNAALKLVKQETGERESRRGHLELKTGYALF